MKRLIIVCVSVLGLKRYPQINSTPSIVQPIPVLPPTAQTATVDMARLILPDISPSLKLRGEFTSSGSSGNVFAALYFFERVPFGEVFEISKEGFVEDMCDISSFVCNAYDLNFAILLDLVFYLSCTIGHIAYRPPYRGASLETSSLTGQILKLHLSPQAPMRRALLATVFPLPY